MIENGRRKKRENNLLFMKIKGSTKVPLLKTFWMKLV